MDTIEQLKFNKLPEFGHDVRMRDITRSIQRMLASRASAEPITIIDLLTHLSSCRCEIYNENEIHVVLGALYSRGQIDLFWEKAFNGRFIVGFAQKGSIIEGSF